MKRLGLLVFLGVAFNLMHSQEGKYAALKAEQVRNLSYVGFNLLTPADMLNPRYRFSYLRSFDEKWMADVALGFGGANISNFGYQNKIEDDYRLWEVRLAARKIAEISKNRVYYFGPELFYLNHSDVLTNNSYFPVGGQSIGYDSADYNRTKYGLNLKYGIIFNRHRQFTFDFYAGFGLAFRTNTFKNLINPEIVDLGPEGGDMFGFENYLRQSGTVLKFNTILGLNLLYTLKK